MENERLVLAHIQHVARHFGVFRGKIEVVAEWVARSMGDQSPDTDTLANYLRKQSTLDTLYGGWETCLAPNLDTADTWRLVSIAVTTEPHVARRRLSMRPTDPRRQCAFCHVDTGNRAEYALAAYKDVAGNVVPGIFLHELCMRPYKQLMELAALAAERNELL